MTLRRLATTLAALVVAGIAAYASYSHMRHLALQYGQEEVVADLLPISVDGMLVVATIALGDGRAHRWSAWLAFWVGVGASVTANVLAAQDSAIARSISAWPAIAFLLVVEVLTRGGQRRRPTTSTAHATPPPVPAEPVIEQVNEPILAVEPVPVPTPNGRTPAAAKVKTDAQLLAALRNPKRVPRDPDGTVPIRRAANTLGCGPERAKRLLDQEGLLRTGDDNDQADEPVPAELATVT
jgi:hypothetical protein